MTDDLQSRSSHTTIYHALEDKIKKGHATGYLRHDGSSLRTRFAATPVDALAARLKTKSSLIPIPSTEGLPSSDLLDALHGHTSDLYAREAPYALRSMDESALLLLGLIVEQMVEEAIGREGHLLLAATPESLAREKGIDETR